MTTTVQHANVERARLAYEAFGKGDIEAVGQFMADDILWHVGGTNVISGDYRGRDAVFGFFGKLMQETGGTFKSEVHDILANDEHGAVLVTNTAERNGKHFEWRAVNVSHSDSEGRVTEFWAFTENSQEVDEFFS
jgi:ketosteroid isomerase-like protein